MALIPVLNFAVLLMLLSHIAAIITEICVVLRNHRRAPNPFARMVMDRDLSRPCLTRIIVRNRAAMSEHCTISSESILMRPEDQEAMEVIYYRPDTRQNYERMMASAACSCVFASTLTVLAGLSVAVDMCWAAGQSGYAKCWEVAET